MTTWLLGRPEPIVTYCGGYWPFIGILKVGIYTADGLTIAVRENPDYVPS